MSDLFSIARSKGFELPSDIQSHRLAKYHWWGIGRNKSKYVVRTNTNTFVFGSVARGCRYKVVNNKLVESKDGQ